MKISTILCLMCLIVVATAKPTAPKVQVMMFEMSQCPPCSDWMQQFDQQVMQAQGLPAIMDISEYFVGQNDGGGQFECMHGPDECVGNLIELCAHNLTAQSVPLGWWHMDVCMQSDYTNIPDNAQGCAQQANLQWDPIVACSKDTQGDNLFAASIDVANNMGVDATPTIFINGQEYVGGPNDPLSAVCSAYTGTPPPGCNNAKKGPVRSNRKVCKF